MTHTGVGVVVGDTSGRRMVSELSARHAFVNACGLYAKHTPSWSGTVTMSWSEHALLTHTVAPYVVAFVALLWRAYGWAVTLGTVGAGPTVMTSRLEQPSVVHEVKPTVFEPSPLLWT